MSRARARPPEAERASRFATVVLLTLLAPAAASSVNLRYVGDVRDDDFVGRHLMGVETVFDDYALIASGDGLCLLDLSTVLPDATGTCVSSIPYLDATTTVTRPDGIAYVNLRQAGFGIVSIDPGTLHMVLLGTIAEPDVFFDKMTLAGDRLYVAAHAHGLRIYDLAQPTTPVLVGSLTEGLDDAFAVAVAGQTAYVADGAGGLKIVDLTDEANPVIVDGETPQTALGTAEDVTIVSGRVYVAAGGAGVAVYDLGDVQSRTVYDTPACAKHLAVVGTHLAVADIRGLEVFSIETDGSLIRVAGEAGTYRGDASDMALRMWHGVSAWGANRIVVADWDGLDVYELAVAGAGDQPDVTASTQRLRFPPAGGSLVVRLANDGAAPLTLTGVTSTQPTFSAQPGAAVLLPGETLDVSVTYEGGSPGEAVLLVYSDDPDENPLPIRVFGDTPFLDPGEPAAPFTLDAWRLDRDTGRFLISTFDVQSYAGKVVYFHVFSTW